MGLETEKMFLSGAIFLSCVAAIFCAEEIEQETALAGTQRDGKFIYASTTTTSTTLTTSKLCFKLSFVTDTIVPCKKRKRSFSGIWDEEPRHTDEEISPTKLAIDDDFPSLESGVDELRKGADEEEGRTGKFLNYFITITKTSTITSYSATSTVASVACTPYEFSMDM